MLQIQSELSGKDIELLFDSIDQNGDGSISFLEFVAAMIDPREVDIQHMQEVRSIQLLLIPFFRSNSLTPSCF